MTDLNSHGGVQTSEQPRTEHKPANPTDQHALEDSSKPRNRNQRRRANNKAKKEQQQAEGSHVQPDGARPQNAEETKGPSRSGRGGNRGRPQTAATAPNPTDDGLPASQKEAGDATPRGGRGNQGRRGAR